MTYVFLYLDGHVNTFLPSWLPNAMAIAYFLTAVRTTCSAALIVYLWRIVLHCFRRLRGESP